MRRRRPLRAELSLSSRNLNCNQLIRAVSFPADTLRIEADTAATDLKLFVVPKNIDFALHTDFRRVRYGKFVFEDVRGAVDVPRRDRAPEGPGHEGAGCSHAHDAALPGRAAERGYVGFDFRPAAHQCRKAGRIHPVARQHRAHAAVVPGNGRFRWSRRRPIWTRRSTSGFRPFVRPSASGATASC